MYVHVILPRVSRELAAAEGQLGAQQARVAGLLAGLGLSGEPPSQKALAAFVEGQMAAIEAELQQLAVQQDALSVVRRGGTCTGTGVAGKAVGGRGRAWGGRRGVTGCGGDDADGRAACVCACVARGVFARQTQVLGARCPCP